MITSRQGRTQPRRLSLKQERKNLEHGYVGGAFQSSGCDFKLLFLLQLYNSRKKHLKNKAEEKLWNDITWELMSDESEVDEDTINKHRLPFRSEGTDSCQLLQCTSHNVTCWRHDTKHATSQLVPRPSLVGDWPDMDTHLPHPKRQRVGLPVFVRGQNVFASFASNITSVMLLAFSLPSKCDHRRKGLQYLLTLQAESTITQYQLNDNCFVHYWIYYYW